MMYHPLTLAVAARFLRQPYLQHLHDDVLGLAQLAIVEAEAKYDPQRHRCREAFIVHVATRYCYDRLHDLTGCSRASARRGRVPLECEYDPDRYGSVDDEAEERASDRLALRAVIEAALELPERQQQVIEAALADKPSDSLSVHRATFGRHYADAVRTIRRRLGVQNDARPSYTQYRRAQVAA